MTHFERLYTERILLSLKDYTIQDEDDYHDAIHEAIDNMCTYTSDNKQAVDDLNYDIFQEDDLFGRAENWGQAAYNAIYHNFYENGPCFEEYAANNLIAQ
jgi:hypothetical protein